MWAELVSIGMIYRMSSHNAMVIIALMRREGVGQLVDMSSLQCHGVAIATRQAELQHKRVEHGVGAKRLACHREAELRVEARFGSAKDGIFRRAQQGVGRIGRVDRVEIRMADDSHGVGMVDIHVFALADEVVADGVGRLPTRSESQ